LKKIISIILSIFICCSVCYADQQDNYGENSQLNYSLKLPVISKDEAIDIAIEYLYVNDTDAFAQISTDSNYSISYSKTFPYGYSITFPRIINNLDFYDDNVTIFVDGMSGEVLSCQRLFSDDIVIPDNNNIISLDEAKEKYMASNGLELRYNKKIENGKIITYLTYSPNERIIVNAETGNVIVENNKLPTDGYFDVTLMSEKATTFMNGNESVISLTSADNIVRSIEEFGISDDFQPTTADYIKDYDGTYYINITYQNSTEFKNITLNAKNGNVVEYWDNSSPTSEIQHNTVEFIENFVERHYADYIPNTIKHIQTDKENTVLLYERQVNGIPYKSNGLYICTDCNGKITSLSFAWDDVVFDDASTVLPIGDAYKEYFDKCGLELSYYKRDNNVITPVYVKTEQITGILDAKSLKMLNYDGSKFYKTKELNYLDIDTHYSKDIATILANADIFASSGNVYLGDSISQKDYLYLLTELIPSTKPVLSSTGVLNNDQLEMLYSYMLTNNIIEEKEISYDGYVTRADAVKYLLRILGYGDVANMTEIYKSHFADAHIMPKEMLGYIELARGLKLVNGSDDNFFYPMDNITNGDSLIIIYNYLSRKQVN